MGDAALGRQSDTEPVELPGRKATRERCTGSEARCELAHDYSPLLGTDGTRNLMTLLGEAQVPSSIFLTHPDTP
jgi:hypothetical protein